MNDQEILHKYGLSDEWVEKDSARVEDETQSDNGLPPEHRENDELVTLSVRIPHSLMEAATQEAKKYHLTRSEYVRRALIQAQG